MIVGSCAGCPSLSLTALRRCSRGAASRRGLPSQGMDQAPSSDPPAPPPHGLYDYFADASTLAQALSPRVRRPVCLDPSQVSSSDLADVHINDDPAPSKDVRGKPGGSRLHEERRRDRSKLRQVYDLAGTLWPALGALIVHACVTRRITSTCTMPSQNLCTVNPFRLNERRTYAPLSCVVPEQ